MNALVTGGAGFIGSNLVRGLLCRGHRVRVLDNLSTGCLSNIEHLDVDFVEGDITDIVTCSFACRGIEVVYHQAAMPSVSRSIEFPAASHDNNINGTFNVLLAAKEAGCRRVIYAASSSAYGDQDGDSKHESMLPSPLSPYGLQKLVGEYYCKVFNYVYGLETVALRYFNVFGPRQSPKSQYAAVIPAFIAAIIGGNSPVIYGDGTQTRDFTYVDNVVHANILASRSPLACGQVINVACGERIMVNDVAALINQFLEKDIEPCHESIRVGDIKHSCADIGLARKLLDYEPVVNFKDGLQSTIEWFGGHV